MVAGADHHDEEGLLGRCPWCRYSLAGLPVEHVCPECGRAFDRRWVVFGAGFLSKGARLTRAIFRGMAVILLVMQLSLTWLLMTYARPIELRWAALTATWLPNLVAIWLLLARARRNVMLMVGAGGVRVYRGTKELRYLSWAEVGKARYIGTRNAIEIGTGDQRIRVKTFDLFGWDQFQIHPCLMAINESPWRDGGAENVSSDEPVESD